MKREYLTPREWRDLFEQQGQRCASCDERDGPFEADHSNPSYYAGGKPDQLLCVPCHRAKTAQDKAHIAKTKRLNGETSSQASRRAERAEKGMRPYFASRGFPNAKRQRQRTREEILNG